MRVRTVGADGLLLEVDDPAAWFAEVQRRRAAGEVAVLDIVPGARTLLLDGLADPVGTAEAIRTWRPTPTAASTGPERAIPVVFDGPDLDDVAGMWGVSPAEVVARLERIPWHVAFCGFAPGFAYLAGLPYQFGRVLDRLGTVKLGISCSCSAAGAVYRGARRAQFHRYPSPRPARCPRD